MIRHRTAATASLAAALLATLPSVFAAAGPAAAPQAAAAPPPAASAPAAARFALEEIRVVGLERASPRTVLAATLLEPGESYGEPELARAVARVQRLPFVLDARFRLEKGSERGRYVLLVEVVETRRFFFGAQLSVVEYGRPLALGNDFGPGGSDVRPETLAGVRQTIGSAGELTASLATEEGFQLAYTHYDLFGRGAVGGLAIAGGGTLCCRSEVLPLGLVPELTHFSLNEHERVEAHLAVPIRGDHAWRVSAALARAERLNLRPVSTDQDALFVRGDDFERRSLGLGWIFDDTDDPLLPTVGRRFELGLERLEVDYRPRGSFVPDPRPEPELDGREIGSDLTRLHASASWFLPVGLRQTLSFHARSAVGRGDAEWVRATGVDRADLTSFELSAGAGHTWRLWRSPAEDPRPAELWVESGLEAGWESTDGSGALADNPILRLAADVGLAYRNTWGLFRFVLGYRDLPEVD